MHRSVFGKRQENKPLGRGISRCEDNIKLDVMVCTGLYWDCMWEWLACGLLNVLK